MILYRWRGEAPNFGDELNNLLWPALLPGLFDDDPAERFLGIGSVLDARHPRDVVKLVAGAGYGGYEKRPALDASWIIHWVRGPRTARILGLPRDLALGDPALLLPVAGVPLATGDGSAIGFMPHFESMARGAWHAVAEQAGITLIDPRGEPASIVAAIRGCRLLLSEALHGVIVADALRVPWIAIQPRAAMHRAKWQDWADTVSLRLAFRSLPASSLPEAVAALRGMQGRAGRTWVGRLQCHAEPVLGTRFRDHAAAALRRAASATPQLSAASDLERSQARMLDRTAALRREPRRGHSAYRRQPSHVHACAPAMVSPTTEQA